MNDIIVDIKCGNRHSIFLTENGKVWATGNFKEECNSRLQQIKKELNSK